MGSACGDEPRFPQPAAIGMEETRAGRGGRTEHERRFDLSCAKRDAKTFAAAARALWHIDTRLHRVLDAVRVRTDKHSLKVRQKPVNLSLDSLETLHQTVSRKKLKRSPCRDNACRLRRPGSGRPARAPGTASRARLWRPHNRARWLAAKPLE